MSNLSQHTRHGRGWLAAVVVSLCLAGLTGGCNKDEAKSDGGGGAGSGAAAGPDLSTPKAAATAFAKAVVANDMKTAKAATTGSDADFKTVEAMAGVMAAFRDFEAASVAKFGDAGKLPGDAKMPDLVAEVEKNEIKVDGDKATMIDKAKPDDKNPLTLVKKDGKWHVDLASMGPDAKSMGDSGPKMKKALDDTAAEIKAGKFKTPAEAMAALGPRMAGVGGPG